MSKFGPWAERLETIAVGREVIAVAGRRDAQDVTTSNIHVLPTSLLDGKGTAWSFDAGSAVASLALVGDDLLLSGGADGRLVAWDVTRNASALASSRNHAVAQVKLGAGIRAIALDTEVARGASGSIAIGTAAGVLHVVPFAIQGGVPTFGAAKVHALSDGAIDAVCWDPAGMWLAGAADGQLWVVGANAPRPIAPGGDGGIRAIAAVGDGRAVLGCGDGSLRVCFVVGDVEPHDRSGDHGHQGALRGIVLGPTIVDDAGREQARRLFTVGEDGAIKVWFLDGARRPKTVELAIGPLTAIAFAQGPVAKVEKAAGRLWIASANRQVAAVVVGGELDVFVETTTFASVFSAYKAQLSDPKVAVKVKMEAVTALSMLAEDEARVLLDLALASGPPEVRIAAAAMMVSSRRRASRPALRVALSGATPELRAAAFKALLALERDQPLAAIRAGLAVAHEDVRMRAVDALVPLAPASVIAQGMIAEALRDGNPNVRNRAYIALRQTSPTPLEAIRTALSRGSSDVRARGLLDLGFVLGANDASARELAAGAFDDEDAGVRASAFMAAVAMRPELAGRLVAKVPSVRDFWERVAQDFPQAMKPPVDSGRTLEDDELEPLFAQLACRHADAAIRGAGSLLALGDLRAVGAVLQLTREADPALRRTATTNLVRALEMWPGDDRLAARLWWLLDDPDTEVRGHAFDALATLAMVAGATAELELANIALRTSQEDIRVRALQVLVRIGAPGGSIGRDPADALLGDALDDEAPKVRTEAFRTLWAWHTADPIVPLARGAQSRHADLRKQVVDELGRRRAGGQATPAMEQLQRTLVGDPVALVGLAAYADLTTARDGKDLVVPADVHAAALNSPVAAVRVVGAKGAHQAPASAVRARLVELVKDENPEVNLAAIEALDAVAPTDAEGFALAFASPWWDLQVRAGELLGARRDARAIAPMQRILSAPKTDINRAPDVIRQRAARALADVGDPSTIAFQRSLIEDEDLNVREMAARGLATAAQVGNGAALAALLALLAHPDLPVRSWGGEGLAKLGDLRALPVLAGTQRHSHRPLRIGAIVGFVALGPDGVRGLRQGLEDSDRAIQDLAFSVIVARDAALAAAGIAPDLLVDAMSSPSPEIRFAAARLFERRAAGEALDAEVIGDIVGPRRPAQVTDQKLWPAAARRTAILQVLADAIASDQAPTRYAAAQVLAVRDQPLTFWREAQRLSGPARQAPAPLTSWSTEARIARRTGWLRRLVHDRRDPDTTELEALALIFLRAGAATTVDAAAAQRLVFGVYAGLVRQAPEAGQADETHRVRRDAVARLLELAREDAVGIDAVLPVLGHAVSDPHHLVRQAALSALRSLYPIGALAPLQQAIAGAADLGKPAIDELVGLALEGDDRATALVRSALDADDADVRAYAALRLAKLYPVGSPEPQLLAARSAHGDVRLAAITQLATAPVATPAITEALVAALASEHVDLRLRAAVALARGGNPLGVDVLGGFLRTDDHADEALTALVALADRPDSAAAAASAITARLDDDPDRTADRRALLGALQTLGHPSVAPSIVRLLVDVVAGKESEVTDIVDVALAALLAVLRDRAVKPQKLPSGDVRERYREDLALRAFADAMTSPLATVRIAVARALGDIDGRGAEDILAKQLTDREAEVRTAAAEALALRAEFVPGATLAPLEAALRGGRRELVLPAALGLAARRRPEAFQPLLLVAKAGEGNERERALLALGSLGDRRVLEHLQPLLEPEPDDEASRELTPAAWEALGRLLPALTGDEATEQRARLERTAQSAAEVLRIRALRGLRFAGELSLLRVVAGDPEENQTLRLAAVRELRLANDLASEALLGELLSDTWLSIAEAAREALGSLFPTDRTRVALIALGSTHDEISRPAATYLASAGDPATLAERLATVKSAPVRQLLREGLIRRGEAAATAASPQLATALRSTEPQARAESAMIAGAAAATALVEPITAAVARGEEDYRAARTQRAAEARLGASVDAWRAALWAARRVQAQGAVETSALAAVTDERAPSVVRRQAANALAEAGSAGGLRALSTAVGDADREVRSVAAATLAAKQPASAAQLVRGLGGRADAATLAPLALGAWPTIAGELLAQPATRSFAAAVSLIGDRAAELITIAKTKGGEGRLAAIRALGELGGDAANIALEAIHADDGEDDTIKLAAWKALKRLLRKVPKEYGDVDKRTHADVGGGAAESAGHDDSVTDNDDGDDSDADDDDDGDVEDDDEDDAEDEDEDDEEEDEDDE